MGLSVRTAALPFVFLVAACHDVPQAPSTPPPPAVSPFSVIVLNRLSTDYPTWWGVDVLVDDAQEVHVLGVNFADWHRFVYNGCNLLCQQFARWYLGVPDSTTNCCDANQGAVLTAQGIAVVLEVGGGIQLKTCYGDCFKASSWVAATLFPHGYLGYYYGGHSHPLAVDSAGGLHLLYHAMEGGPLWYAECPAACADATNWQSLEIDPDTASGSLVADAAIALDHAGGIHVVGATFAGPVQYLACQTGCVTAAKWSSTVIDTAVSRSPSLLWASDSVLRVAYVGSSTRVATCDSQCTTSASWTSVSVATRARDASLAIDGMERLWLAVAGPSMPFSQPPGSITATVELLHCNGNCAAASSWVTQIVDSMTSDGWISLAMDRAGNPHFAVTGFELQYAQLRDTTIFASQRCSTSCPH